MSIIGPAEFTPLEDIRRAIRSILPIPLAWQ